MSVEHFTMFRKLCLEFHLSTCPAGEKHLLKCVVFEGILLMHLSLSLYFCCSGHDQMSPSSQVSRIAP